MWGPDREASINLERELGAERNECVLGGNECGCVEGEIEEVYIIGRGGAEGRELKRERKSGVAKEAESSSAGV